MKYSRLPHFKEKIEQSELYSNEYWTVNIHWIRFDNYCLQQYVCLMPKDSKGHTVARFYFRSVYDAFDWIYRYKGHHSGFFWNKKMEKRFTREYVLNVLYSVAIKK